MQQAVEPKQIASQRAVRIVGLEQLRERIMSLPKLDPAAGPGLREDEITVLPSGARLTYQQTVTDERTREWRFLLYGEDPATQVGNA